MKELGNDDTLLNTMQTMLSNILSKDILYEPIKSVVCKFPAWLANNRHKITAEEFSKYSKQYALMQKVVEIFDSENDSDDKAKKDINFEKRMEIMQELQVLGDPPAELIEGSQYPKS